MADQKLTGWLLMPRRRLLHLFVRPQEEDSRFSAPCGVSKPSSLRGLSFAEGEAQPERCSRCIAHTRLSDIRRSNG